MERVVVGSKEYMVVRIRDRLNRISDLNDASPNFDVRQRGSSSWKLQGQSADTDGLNALCLVDTTDWDVGTYELFLTFIDTPEQPRLGPFAFDVA